MKNKFLIILTLLSLVVFQTTDQNTIAGNFSLTKGQTIRLMGYHGADVFEIDSSIVNAQGNFELHYSDSSLGMGYLLTAEDNSYMVVLEGCNRWLWRVWGWEHWMALMNPRGGGDDDDDYCHRHLHNQQTPNKFPIFYLNKEDFLDRKW